MAEPNGFRVTCHVVVTLCQDLTRQATCRKKSTWKYLLIVTVYHSCFMFCFILFHPCFTFLDLSELSSQLFQRPFWLATHYLVAVFSHPVAGSCHLTSHDQDYPIFLLFQHPQHLFSLFFQVSFTDVHSSQHYTACFFVVLDLSLSLFHAGNITGCSWFTRLAHTTMTRATIFSSVTLLPLLTISSSYITRMCSSNAYLKMLDISRAWLNGPAFLVHLTSVVSCGWHFWTDCGRRSSHGFHLKYAFNSDPSESIGHKITTLKTQTSKDTSSERETP